MGEIPAIRGTSQNHVQTPASSPQKNEAPTPKFLRHAAKVVHSTVAQILPEGSKRASKVRSSVRVLPSTTPPKSFRLSKKQVSRLTRRLSQRSSSKRQSQAQPQKTSVQSQSAPPKLDAIQRAGTPVKKAAPKKGPPPSQQEMRQLKRETEDAVGRAIVVTVQSSGGDPLSNAKSAVESLDKFQEKAKNSPDLSYRNKALELREDLVNDLMFLAERAVQRQSSAAGDAKEAVELLEQEINKLPDRRRLPSEEEDIPDTKELAQGLLAKLKNKLNNSLQA